MADGKRRYKSDRKDYKISVKLSEKDMDILKAALKRTQAGKKLLLLGKAAQRHPVAVGIVVGHGADRKSVV